MTEGRLVLVGESLGGKPPHDPALALTGPTGRNLCKWAGWDWDDYLRLATRLNLFEDPPERWDKEEAARRAVALVPRLVGKRVIFLGAKVSAAFGIWVLKPQFRWFDLGYGPRGAKGAVIPHPSGRNRVWNDPAVREAAREFLADALWL